VRVLTRSSRCSTRARRAIAASSISTVFSQVAINAAMSTEMTSASSFLRLCPVESSRTRAASLAGTSICSSSNGAAVGAENDHAGVVSTRDR